MKNFLIFTAFILFFFLSTNSTNACFSYPNVYAGEGCEIIFNENNFNDLTQISKELNIHKEKCDFSVEDIETISNYIANGYTVLKQTNDEYVSFLEAANNLNSNRPENCQAYSAISHKNGWTGFSSSGNYYEDGICSVPNCGGIAVNIKWNDLTPPGAQSIKLKSFFSNNIIFLGSVGIIIPITILLLVKKIKHKFLLKK